MKSRSIGRPRKTDDERKESMFCIRLTAEERSAIDDAASSSGLPASQWARAVLLANVPFYGDDD